MKDGNLDNILSRLRMPFLMVSWRVFITDMPKRSKGYV